MDAGYRLLEALTGFNYRLVVINNNRYNDESEFENDIRTAISELNSKLEGYRASIENIEFIDDDIIYKLRLQPIQTNELSYLAWLKIYRGYDYYRPAGVLVMKEINYQKIWPIIGSLAVKIFKKAKVFYGYFPHELHSQFLEKLFIRLIIAEQNMYKDSKSLENELLSVIKELEKDDVVRFNFKYQFILSCLKELAQELSKKAIIEGL